MKAATTGNGTFLRLDGGDVEYRAPHPAPKHPPRWTRESWELIQDLLREDGRATATVSVPHDGTGSIE